MGPRPVIPIVVALLLSAPVLASGSYTRDDTLPATVFPVSTRDAYSFPIVEGQLVRVSLTWDVAEGNMYLRQSQQADGKAGCDRDDEVECYTRMAAESCVGGSEGSLVDPPTGRVDMEFVTELEGRAIVYAHASQAPHGIAYRIEISVDGQAPEVRVTQHAGIGVATVVPGAPRWQDAVCPVLR